ncbi:MAG: hypothetical protein QME42_09550 [bacterium]|nr:hypothetical protein [bacterium]
MNLEEKWQRAIKETEIVRHRISQLFTFKPTDLPYIFLAESGVNIGDTVVRKGKILVHEASIILPPNFPQFEGFDFEESYHIDKDSFRAFLLLRGVTFPSFKYLNETYSIDIYEGNLEKAVKHFQDELEKAEDVHSGLVVGPDDCWQFSVLFFVLNIVSRSASNDVKRLLKDFREKGNFL